MVTQPSREVPARVGAWAPGPSVSTGERRVRSAVQVLPIFIGVPSCKPPFFPLNFGDFFKMAFPPGEGGHGGEQRGPAKIMDKISKVVRYMRPPIMSRLKKKRERVYRESSEFIKRFH